MRRLIYTVFIIYILGCMYFPIAKKSTRNSEKNKNTKTTISIFRITDQIPDWIEVQNTYKQFSPKELYEIIDGGADAYIECGIKKGIYYSIKTIQDQQCDIFAEDFGSEQNFIKIYNSKKESISEPLRINQFGDKNITAEEIIGGVTIYMCETKYYFELSLSGFDTEELALEKASAIICYLLKIIASQ